MEWFNSKQCYQNSKALHISKVMMADLVMGILKEVSKLIN